MKSYDPYSGKPKGMPYSARDGNEKFRGRVSGDIAQVMGHASPVYSIETMSEGYDMGRMDRRKQDPRGYAKQAWEYQY